MPPAESQADRLNGVVSGLASRTVIHGCLTLLYGEPAEVAFGNRYTHLASQPLVCLSARHGSGLPDPFKRHLAALARVAGWLVCQSPERYRCERMKPDVCSAAFAKIDIRPVTEVAPIDFSMSADPY